MRGIYKIIHEASGKYYVGSSRNISRRWYKHRKNLGGNYHSNSKLQRAWAKYGPDAFKFIIVEEVPENTPLFEVEQRYLDVAKAEQERCYNLKFATTGWDWDGSAERLLASLPRGKNHKDYCADVHTFTNDETGETFVGTRCDFYTKYGLMKHHVRLLVQGKRHTVRGWRVA